MPLFFNASFSIFQRYSELKRDSKAHFCTWICPQLSPPVERLTPDFACKEQMGCSLQIKIFGWTSFLDGIMRGKITAPCILEWEYLQFIDICWSSWNTKYIIFSALFIRVSTITSLITIALNERITGIHFKKTIIIC